MKTQLLLSAVLLSIGTVANAETLAGGAVYGGVTQTQVACYLFNAGIGAVTVTTNSIYQEGIIAPLPLTADTCNTLAPGATCVIATNVGNNATHSCRMVVTPTGSDVRGSIEIRDIRNNVLNNQELR
jgi:hypothetical protein